MDSPVLYRLYDANGRLLYIGKTINHWTGRMSEHRNIQPWWHEVAQVRLEPYLTDHELSAAEIAAIKSERPRYNVVHNRSHSQAPKRVARDKFHPDRPSNFNHVEFLSGANDEFLNFTDAMSQLINAMNRLRDRKDENRIEREEWTTFLTDRLKVARFGNRKCPCRPGRQRWTTILKQFPHLRSQPKTCAEFDPLIWAESWDQQGGNGMVWYCRDCCSLYTSDGFWSYDCPF